MSLKPVLVSRVSKRLKEYRELTKEDFPDMAKKTGVPVYSLSRYVLEQRAPKVEVVSMLAEGLDVDFMWLAGYNVPMRPDTWLPNNLDDIEVQRVPMIGNIAGGMPITAEEHFDGYVKCGAAIQCDFCLNVKGDSMIGDNIKDGSIVFIKKQPSVENGQIAAVLIGDEATLKHVYYTGKQLTLVASNPAYPPMVYSGDELDNVRILGKAVAFQTDIK